MKFGKWLKRQIEQSLPAWREHFLRYKELKGIVSSAAPPSPAEFVALLEADIDKINAFFIEQEEEFIIRHRELQEAIRRAVEREAAAEVAAIRREMVNFHGEMVLLLNYSSVNYIGLAKILKKYDKRTGAALRLAVVETAVLGQPFFTAEAVSLMVKECEAMMMFPAAAAAASASAGPGEAMAAAAAEQRVFRDTVAALLAMEDVRSGSSTRGRHSLPPLTLPDSDWLRSFQPPSPIPIQTQ
ncbi:SPX domain-containing protein 6 [Brachypodium distachyon]|uniref:SPX domain-containing protein n=1 Tax=Brachypodium distachyon TaxID=15368 RepID=I1GSD8_BRADI|nr:SPX domain-containing protein 6 [Brachypodium distachyon]XP_014757442.1 SPX domain-containing protein 6 [Brachypodium distachyon]KQK15263.1 hypothetical protein BRADI_1g21510v3 [Brachypodium distachyon]|eukprot:XP_003559963.1 SPX domain-containing protein 6 [Brachypodium distachyon]